MYPKNQIGFQYYYLDASAKRKWIEASGWATPVFKLIVFLGGGFTPTLDESLIISIFNS